MSIIAAMTYLRTLRRYHKLSQATIATAVGVEARQVYRWEKGESEPHATALAAFIDAVRGVARVVHDLLRDEQATADAGRAAANARIAELQRPPVPDLPPVLLAVLDRIESKIDTLAHEQHAELAALRQQLDNIAVRLPPVDPDA